MTTDLIPRTTLAEMVGVWKQASEDIRQAFSILVATEKRLKEVFKPDSYLFDLSRDNHRYRDYERPDELLKELKKDVWKSLIDRMELRRVLSVKKSEELDRQLQSGEGLPEIEEAAILGMLEGTLASIPNYIEDAVKEVFDYLRPRRSKLKTNSEFEIGHKVILGWSTIRHNYGVGWSINYGREANLRAVDNVFHALDGNGTVKTTRGPLIDAIEATRTTGLDTGETQYFKFKCFGNGNLHLEFKRTDLVEKLNAVAGGMRLKESKEGA